MLHAFHEGVVCPDRSRALVARTSAAVGFGGREHPPRASRRAASTTSVPTTDTTALRAMLCAVPNSGGSS
jgi:hypothetical protein